MAINEKLTIRVRQALSLQLMVEEKKMFGGVAFLVNDKLCVTVGNDRLMLRIDPTMHDEAIKHEGVSTVVMKGREYKGYVYVKEAAVKNKKDFDDWIALALAFNAKAKSSKKNRK